MRDLDALLQQVKFNCNVSDAKFWGYFSICGLLMRYRELYRSENSLSPWQKIGTEEMGRWIHEREMLWRDIESAEFQDIVLEGKSYGPFDIDSLNAALRDEGLLYGAGYGTFNKPTFFIAQLDHTRDYFDYPVHYAGAELCRDLAASPAMLQGRCIYIRPEVISSFLWDRFQEMKLKPFSGLTEELFSHYRISRSETISRELCEKFSDMVLEASEVFVLHEAGEAFEDADADAWHEMLGSGADKATELHLRAIKDILADTSVMGPLKMISSSRNRPGLIFFLTFLDGIRKTIFPEIVNAFPRFRETGDWSVIEKARSAGYQRAATLQSELVFLWKQQKEMTVLAKHLRETF
jgi:hypothetical protein